MSRGRDRADYVPPRGASTYNCSTRASRAGGQQTADRQDLVPQIPKILFGRGPRSLLWVQTQKRHPSNHRGDGMTSSQTAGITGSRSRRPLRTTSRTAVGLHRILRRARLRGPRGSGSFMCCVSSRGPGNARSRSTTAHNRTQHTEAELSPRLSRADHTSALSWTELRGARFHTATIISRTVSSALLGTDSRSLLRLDERQSAVAGRAPRMDETRQVAAAAASPRQEYSASFLSTAPPSPADGASPGRRQRPS